MEDSLTIRIRCNQIIKFTMFARREEEIKHASSSGRFFVCRENFVERVSKDPRGGRIAKEDGIGRGYGVI